MSYVEVSKCYVLGDKPCVGDTNSYIGLTESYIGDNGSYVEYTK